MFMNPNHFISKNKYYLISLFDKIFHLIWKIATYLGVGRNHHKRNNRIIFIGPTHIGDILLTTPAIRFVKEKKPDVEIICIASSSSKAAIVNNPYLAGVEIIDLPWFTEKKGGLIRSIRCFFYFVKVIKSVNAETALNFSSTSYHREHLAMWLAGVPRRIGFTHKGFGYFLTDNLSFLRNELIVKQKLRMVGHWLKENTNHYSLKPDYFISKGAGKKAEDLLESLGINKGKVVIGINPGAQHNFLWPVSNYIELANMIYNKWKANLLFLGTNSFESLIEHIRTQLEFKTFSLAGKTSLEESAAIMKKIDLLISVDTGARHIANAVSTKVVVLRNGANSIYEFGKYVESEKLIFHEVPCSPCGLQKCKYPRMYCMEDISAKECFYAVASHGIK